MSGRFLRGLLRGATRLTIKPLLGPGVPVRWQRRLLKLPESVTRTPRQIAVRKQPLGGVAGEWLGTPVAGDSPVILYLHGGGYCVGSTNSHRPITASLVKFTGCAVYSADYRLAPEHPHPAALDDALAVYRALLAAGHRRLILAGDSAGAGLALATALALRDAALAPPQALLLLSPWADLSCSGATMQTQAAQDPMLSAGVLTRWAREYLGALPPEHPACSPLFGELRGLPPVLIQVGRDEVLLDDSLRLQQRLQQAGVPVQLQVVEGMWHDFHLHVGTLAEADQAFADIDRYLRDVMG
jgi:monoterpene epsilon-lactone hydrolase